MNHLSPETLNLYLDDMLDPPARESAATHLATCAVCQGELAALQALFSALEALPSEPLPIDLTDQVLQRIAPMPRSTAVRPAQGRIQRPHAAAALAAQVMLAALLGVWFGPALAGAMPEGLAVLRGLAPPDPAALLVWLGRWGAAFQAAVSALAQASDMSGAVPIAGIPSLQWALIVAGVAIIWLFGNRLLLAGSYKPRNTRQEAA